MAVFEVGKVVAVATTSTLVVGETFSRQELIVTNDSDTTIYLRLASSGAVVGQGIRLNAEGGAYVGGWSGPVSAIHGGAGTKNLCVAAF